MSDVFRTLLPPNATRLELKTEEAIRYDLDVTALSGFKLNAANSNLSLILSWEFSLSKIPIEDLNERIKEGIKFHMYCGTLYALRMALGWYGLDNVIIEEEEPGAHFAEFQIGCDGVPDINDIAKIVEIAELAAPLRSRLSRMYNDLWDIRRFILDSSPWGDLLSDHSGYKLNPDWPKFSFGRINDFDPIEIPTPVTGFFATRWHFAYAVSSDVYRLDWAILDETDPGTLNHGMSREAYRYMFNSDFIGSGMGNIFQSRKIAKALPVLSEDAELDDINTCFSCGTVEYDETPFELCHSLLSQSSLTSTPVLISYRSLNEKYMTAADSIDATIERGYRSRAYCTWLNYANVLDIDHIQTIERYSAATYKGNNIWHDQQHFDVSWNDQKNYLGQMR